MTGYQGPVSVIQYPIRHLIIRSPEVSKPRDWCLELCDHSKLCEAPWQHCCWGTCEISKQYHNPSYQFRDIMRSYGKVFCRMLKRGPGQASPWWLSVDDTPHWHQGTGPHTLLLWADSRFVPSQWETTLLCNAVSHWLGASLESAVLLKIQWVLLPHSQLFPKMLTTDTP